MNLYTIIVQLINFIILVFILNKILYKPLLKIIETKQNLIKKEKEEIEKNFTDSEILKNKYLEKNKEFEDNKKELKKQVLTEVDDFKLKEFQKAEKELEIQREKITNQINVEKKNLLNDYNSNMLDLFINYSNFILSNLSNSTLQDQLINKFLEKINLLDSEKINELNKNIQSKSIYIYSNDIITDKNKELIKETLIKKGLNFLDIQYSISENILLGIELKINSTIISWNIKEVAESFVSQINKESN